MPRANFQVGVRGKSCVVLGVEKKSALQLQDPRTVRKVAMLDDHVCVAFAGMSSFYHFMLKWTDDRSNG
jgi:20S proteasome subunit alpha 4